MNGNDKVALPWLAQHKRNPVPRQVVWHQSSVTHDCFYWLAVPPGTATPGSLVEARIEGQTINITKAEGITQLLIRLDDRMMNLDQEVSVVY